MEAVDHDKWSPKTALSMVPKGPESNEDCETITRVRLMLTIQALSQSSTGTMEDDGAR